MHLHPRVRSFHPPAAPPAPRASRRGSCRHSDWSPSKASRSSEPFPVTGISAQACSPARIFVTGQKTHSRSRRRLRSDSNSCRGIEIGQEGARAVWDPVFTGDEGERLVTIAARMPGSARAATAPAAVTAPDAPPADVLRQSVAMLLDHLVRSTATTTARAANRDGQSAHDRWLEALLAADGRLDRRLDADRMAAQIAQWRRPIATAEHSPFRLCFRLEEPDPPAGTDSAPDDAWYVRYLLQPYADPSLLISSADGWDGGVGDRLASALGASGAREFLLSGLGQAAGISTRVANSLENVRPDGFSLDTKEAYEFLSEEALALEEAGFGVLLPSWWARKGAGLRLSARAKIPRSRAAGRQRHPVAGHARRCRLGCSAWRSTDHNG